MKKALALVAVVLSLGLTVATMDAEAKRLGGARSSGMQRQQTTQPATPQNAPGAPAQAAPAAAGTAAGAAAAAPKRSWMGPLAGLAAGLGLAALASHFGFGAGLANIMMMVLIGVAVMAVIGMVMRKRAAAANPSLAGAGAGAGDPMRREPVLGGSGTRIGSALGGGMPAASTQATAIPAGFDTAAFSRNAKEQFMALQAANDARDVQRLRDYLTPEMFEEARAEVEARGDAAQRTEVFGLEAQVLEVAEEADRYIVSVRFTGSVREQPGAVPEDLDEVWHLTKPRTGFGGWLIAGIQQVAPAA
ncbi:MAG: TIM44-like domain-containing protein [Pseudomonadota bacterium]